MTTKQKPRKSRKSTGPKKDAYQLITDAIIESLEAGTVPWRKPWKSTDTPRSLASKRPYRGINILMLMLTAQAKGYSSPYWATFKQIAERGGHVRKGEKATTVVLWRWVDAKPKDGETAADVEGRKVPFLRWFYVFNTDQCDDLEVELPEEREHEPLVAAEEIVAGYKTRPEIKHGQGQAFYSPELDYVGMPRPEEFESGERYYTTLFHELTHSTGHESRVNRKLSTGFGSEPYAREELVAEIGACFLLSEAGIDVQIEQPAAYIAGWLRALRDDNKLVVGAAAAAQKSTDYILGTTFEESTDDNGGGVTPAAGEEQQA